MTWTREPPKVPGFYWLRGAGCLSTGTQSQVVEVFGSRPYFYLAGYDESFKADELEETAEWSGPLEPPA